MSRKFNTNKFIVDVLNDRYALIVGNEIIIDTTFEPSGDVHQYFLRKVNETSSVQYDNYYEIAIDRSERINPVRKLVEDGSITFDVKNVSHKLMTLLETKLFTTILTTTTDGYLEAAMRKVWGNELRIVNIYDKETVDDFQKALKNCRRDKHYNQPTLIYVFGKMDIDSIQKKYVRTDSDAILLIKKWMRMDVESNNEMIDFIRSKRILALGCKYENWYFRFFWYVLTGISKSSEENDYDGMGEVAFTLDSGNKTEGRLLQFLDRTDICILGNASIFIDKIIDALSVESDDNPFHQQLIERRKRGGLFISYCSKDAIAASQLFFKLCDKKYDVWLDNTRLFGGDNYEQTIADAIGASQVFIALLSPNITEHLQNGDTDHYYNKEWRMAQQFDHKIIIPLAINGYNLRADYHKRFEAIVGQQTSGIDLMETDGFSRLLASINEHLKQ